MKRERHLDRDRGLESRPLSLKRTVMPRREKELACERTELPVWTATK